MMKNYFLFIILILSLLCAVSWADEYYSWTDKDGVTHIGTAPATDDANINTHSLSESESTSNKKESKTDKLERQEKHLQEHEERSKEETREANAASDTEWEQKNNTEKCRLARENEKHYRYEYRNAKTQDMTDYYKKQLDEIEEICKKAKM